MNFGIFATVDGVREASNWALKYGFIQRPFWLHCCMTQNREPHNQLNVFYKSCPRAICGYTFKDRVPSADLLAKCKIGGIETFLIQSQLRWAGHVIQWIKPYMVFPFLLLFLYCAMCIWVLPKIHYLLRLLHNFFFASLKILSLEELWYNLHLIVLGICLIIVGEWVENVRM